MICGSGYRWEAASRCTAWQRKARLTTSDREPLPVRGDGHRLYLRNSATVIRIRYVDLSGNPVRRSGWHNLRHSLASWLVSSGVDVKTVSSMLRHSNVRTTLGIYTHAVDSNKLAAQGQFLESLQLGASIQ